METTFSENSARFITSFIGSESTDGISGPGSCDVAAQHEGAANIIAPFKQNEEIPSMCIVLGRPI